MPALYMMPFRYCGRYTVFVVLKTSEMLVRGTA
jgi:hypothetical protein